MREVRNSLFRYDGSSSGDGRDTNAHWIGVDNEPTNYIECEFDANGASEALKITREAKNHIFRNCKFIGGVEDCVDLLGCNSIQFLDCEFIVNHAWQLATIKGGASNVIFSNPVIHGDPKEHTYFDLGGHTIYKDDLRPTKDIVILLPRITNSTKVLSLSRTMNAEKPTIVVSKEYRNHFSFENFSIPKPLWKLYFSLRNKGVIS